MERATLAALSGLRSPVSVFSEFAPISFTFRNLVYNLTVVRGGAGVAERDRLLSGYWGITQSGVRIPPSPLKTAFDTRSFCISAGTLREGERVCRSPHPPRSGPPSPRGEGQCAAYDEAWLLLSSTSCYRRPHPPRSGPPSPTRRRP